VSHSTTEIPLNPAAVLRKWKAQLRAGEAELGHFMRRLNREAANDPRRLRRASEVLAEISRTRRV
jgi:hypothetical protein